MRTVDPQRYSIRGANWSGRRPGRGLSRLGSANEPGSKAVRRTRSEDSKFHWEGKDGHTGGPHADCEGVERREYRECVSIKPRPRADPSSPTRAVSAPSSEAAGSIVLRRERGRAEGGSPWGAHGVSLPEKAVAVLDHAHKAISLHSRTLHLAHAGQAPGVLAGIAPRPRACEMRSRLACVSPGRAQ
ncbi:hypothetical protein BD413DRAFT_591025 [Trametes elegans]|nr:hypothetical protein BD413DRAFT_591025 [Trametes elegans]